jgi:hypothetical protein
VRVFDSFRMAFPATGRFVPHSCRLAYAAGLVPRGVASSNFSSPLCCPARVRLLSPRSEILFAVLVFWFLTSDRGRWRSAPVSPLALPQRKASVVNLRASICALPFGFCLVKLLSRFLFPCRRNEVPCFS